MNFLENFLELYFNGLLVHPDHEPGGKTVLLILLGCAVTGYLIGSLNSAIILSRLMYHDDIRKYGSGNAGMTNMMRVYGKTAAGLTLLFDILKTGVAVWIGILLLGQNAAYISGAACVVGHCYPLYYKFKGGKGVAVTAGLCLFANPPVFLILFIIFAIVVGFTKYISLGSIMSLLFFPLMLRSFYQFLASTNPQLRPFVPPTVLFPALFITVLVILQHRENIKRLWAGEENKFSFKKSKKTPHQKQLDAQREAREDRISNENSDKNK